MSFVTPPWNENVPDWQFDTFTTGYFVVSALTQEGTMKLTFDKTSTGPDSGLNALDPTVTYLEYEIYFNKEGGQNVLIPGSSVPIPSSIIRSPGWNYVKITDRVTVNGQDIGVGNPQKIDCWLITNTTPVPDYVYIDYVAIQRAGDVVGGGTINLGNVTGVLPVQHGGTAVTISTGRSAAVLNVEPVLKNVTLEGDLRSVSNALTIHGNVYTDFLHGNAFGTYGIPLANTTGVLPRWREADPHRTGTGNVLVANVDPIISNSLTVVGDIISSNIIGNVSLTNANGLLPVSAGGTGTTFKTGTGAVVLNTNAVFKGTTTMANVVANFSGNGVGLHTLNVSNATVGVLAVEHGGTGVTTKTGTGNVVLSDNPVLNNVTVSGGLTGNVFGNIFGQSAVLNTLTAPNITSETLFANTSVTTAQLYGNLVGQTSVVDTLLTAPNITSETLFANTSVKTSQLYGNLLGQTAVVDQSITTPTLTVSNNADILGNLSVFGNLVVASGNVVYIDSEIRTSEQIIVDNAGDGAALIVKQSGAQPIMEAQDDGNVVFKIYDEGSVAFASGLDNRLNDTSTAPTGALVSVLGNVSVSQSIDTPHVYGNISGQTAVMDFLVGDGWQVSNIVPANVVGLVQTLEAANANILTLSSNVNVLSANTDALSCYVRSNIDTLSSNVDTLSSNVDTLSANTDALSSYVRSNIDTLSTTVQGYTDTFTTGNLYATVLADLPTTIADSLTVRGNTRLQGNLIIDSGNVVYVESQVDISEQLVVHNQGTGPAVDVLQTGAESLARFVDDGNVVMQMYNWGNVAFASGHSDILNNTTQSPSDALVTVFGSFAADTIRGNISSSNVIGLDTSISDLWANAGDQQTEIIGLQSDTANLWSNAASQQTAIDDLQANAGAQQTDLIDLWSNAASQQTAIGDLQANTGSQQTEITGLLSDTANLWSNAQAQQLEIAQVTNDLSNVFVSLDTGTVTANVFIGDGSQLTNVGSSNASLLTEGTLSQGRLPTTIGNVSTTFIGDGSQLLNVGSSNASLLTEGTLSQERLPTTIGNASTTYVGAEANIVGNVIASAFIGDGSLLTNAGSSNASLLTEGTLSQERLPTTIGNASTTYYGDGGFLSNVSATVDVSNLDLIITSGYIEQDFDVLGNLTGNLVLANTDGTATAPAYAFRNDLGTGLYLGSNALGIAVDSTALATVSSDGLTVNGNISGAYILGNGALLEGVASSNASSLTEGVISQSVLPQTLGNALTDFVGNSLDVTGNVSGSYILGNGALLEGVASSNASSLTEGVISQSVLPQTLGNALTDFVGNSLDASGNVSGSYILGNGFYLDDLNANNLSGNVDGELILTGNIDGDVIFTGELEADVLLVGGNLTFDVPIHLTTGTASNPTLSWANDTTTGIFFTGYGPAFSANGAQVATFGDEGLIVSNVTANMFIGDGGLLSNVSSSQTLRTSFVSEEQSISNVTLVANSLITATSEFTSVFLNGAKLAYVHSTLTDYTTTYVQDVANSTTTLTIEMVTPIGLGDIVDITIQTGNQSHDWYYRV